MQATETALAPVAAPVPVTLIEVEEHLKALLDTEALVTPEDEAEFKAELAHALRNAVEKRDRVAQFLIHCDSQIDLAAAEIARLQRRRDAFEKAADRLKAYVVSAIEAMGTDAKGKYRKLEGHTATLGIQRNPPSTDIEDEAKVPLEYKDASISARCPADRWVAAVAELERLWKVALRRDGDVHPDIGKISDDAKQVMSLILDPHNVKHSVRKADVKKAIDAGAEVPGADVSTGAFRLVVR